MVLYPNAKINLGLNIVEKRSDGYHNIESVFYPVPLADKLEINENKRLTFSTSGIELDSNPENNLVLQAYHKLCRIQDLPPVNLHLHKSIPFGGGLGGGSSDATFCLKGLNTMFNLGLSDEKLRHISSGIGADCPFFINNQPSFVSGIGDILRPCRLDLSGYFLILVKPSVGVPTPVAYKHVKPALPDHNIRDILYQPVKEWKMYLKNDFEDSVFKAFPGFFSIKKTLYDGGAEYASMSGSGSTIYGIFKQDTDLRDRFRDMFYFSCRL